MSDIKVWTNPVSQPTETIVFNNVALIVLGTEVLIGVEFDGGDAVQADDDI